MRISDWSSDVCSSDLGPRNPRWRDGETIRFSRTKARHLLLSQGRHTRLHNRSQGFHRIERRIRPGGRGAAGCEQGFRSEEHTSELQSLMRISYAVFCLKKKKQLN